MARNADGEFEMVLGNKQLLSLLFLVVVLFAVFFSLGYMVGKSVAPAQSQAAQQPPGSETPSSRAPLPEPVKEPPVRRPAESLTPAPEPAPVRSEPAAAKAPQPPPETKEKETEAAASARPVRDMHLQVAAARVREDAEALAASLRKKGYTVVLKSDGSGWHRVLVGPFTSEKAAQEMKLLLEKDGYKSILKKP